MRRWTVTGDGLPEYGGIGCVSRFFVAVLAAHPSNCFHQRVLLTFTRGTGQNWMVWRAEGRPKT